MSDALTLIIAVSALVLAAAAIAHLLHIRALHGELKRQADSAEQRHCAMLTELHDANAKQAERVAAAVNEACERLRQCTTDELRRTGEALHAIVTIHAPDLAPKT